MRLTKKEMHKLLNTHNKASLWRRILAFLIDIIILDFIVLAPLQAILSSYFSEQANFSNLLSLAQQIEPYKGTFFTISIIMAIFSYAYFVILEGLHQQTIGKALMNITVVSNGNKPTWNQILLRNITKAFFMSTLSIIFIIDAVYLLFNKEQRIFDKLAKTEVEQ